MAYFVGTANQTPTVSAASVTVLLPNGIQENDIIAVSLPQNGGGTTIAPDAAAVAAGWVMVGAQAASGACRSAWALCRSGATPPGNPTFTGATDTWIPTAQIVRDVAPTWNLSALTEGVDYKRSDWNNTPTTTSGALTTPDDGRLLVYSWCSDGNAQVPICKLAELTCIDKYSVSGGVGVANIIGYKQQQSAGAAPSVTMYSQVATEGGNGWVLAFPNKSGGAMQPDIRPDITQLKWHGSWETTQDAIVWQSVSNFAATINGIATSVVAPIATFSGSSTQTPWGSFTSLPATDTTASLWVGGTFAISSTDMTGKLFGLQYAIGVLPTSSLAGSEGVLIGFSDGTNWVTYQVAAKSKGWVNSADASATIALGNATVYASSGSINWAAVTRVAYLFHRGGSAATSISISVKHAVLFGLTALTGGGESRPATYNDYQAAMNSWGTWQWAELQGESQVKAKTSIQIGDGINSTYFDGATGSLGFPQAWSASSVANWQMDWNVNSGRVGLFIKASASDTIKLAAGAATSGNAQLFTIDAASSTSATYDFGQAFGGFAPTLKTGITETGTTFTGCAKINAKGSSLTNCTIKNTTATDAAIAWTENGATVTGTTISVTSATSYHISLGAAVTAITLNNNTFTGTPGTDKIYSALASGTLTITWDGNGTSLVAGDVTFVGGSTAVVVIASPTVNQKVTVSGITVGSRVQIYDTTNSVELFNGTASAGNTVVTGSTVVWTDPAAAVGNRAIRIRVAYVSGVTAKNFIETSGLTCGTTSGTASITYPVSPTNDTTYNTNAVNGSLVTGITFTDAATDLVNVNLTGGNTTWPNIYAAFAYWISTSAGIDDDIAYVDAVDPANYLLTSMKIKNTSSPSVPLTITGGFGRSATTGSIVDIIDTTGGNIYPLVDHVVVATVGSGPLTATQDAKLMGLNPPAATVVADAVWAKTLP